MKCALISDQLGNRIAWLCVDVAGCGTGAFKLPWAALPAMRWCVWARSQPPPAARPPSVLNLRATGSGRQPTRPAGPPLAGGRRAPPARGCGGRAPPLGPATRLAAAPSPVDTEAGAAGRTRAAGRALNSSWSSLPRLCQSESRWPAASSSRPLLARRGAPRHVDSGTVTASAAQRPGGRQPEPQQGNTAKALAQLEGSFLSVAPPATLVNRTECA